ncbi:hypothetical protein [uncultured Adlercreutzia sp.]|uniref:hypothetical protein n=1 Tax=uncultured Adlercreutzia sp. TaxID=875803 RepID=UPI0025CBEDE3|nr:hypothetical protein [uncultured Adlercreutzia sp.]MCI9262856.1 hypothetical protein [Eggerthellaceae bacterium]
MEALAVLFEPQNLFVNVICGFPVSVVYYWCVQRILPPRSKKVYWAAAVAAMILTQFLKPVLTPFARMGLGLMGSLAVPFFCLRGSVVRRVLVCLASMLLQFAAEVVCAIVWVSLTGLQLMDNALALAHASAFVAAMIVGQMIVQPLLLTGLRWVCNRVLPEKGEVSSSRWTARFILFPALQMVFFYIVMTLCFDAGQDSLGQLVVVFSLFVLCAMVDAVLFVQMGRWARKREADIEAALLEERLAAYLQDLEVTQRLLTDTAQLRHDLRNHVAVVQLLAARGDYAEAKAYLSEAKAAVGE